MTQPPPIPSNLKNPHAVKRAVFKEILSVRLGHTIFDYSLIEKSHQKAEAWINENPDIEIIQIQTFHSGLHGITVVWYRNVPRESSK